jgi:hypothetical protein
VLFLIHRQSYVAQRLALRFAHVGFSKNYGGALRSYFLDSRQTLHFHVLMGALVNRKSSDGGNISVSLSPG